MDVLARKVYTPAAHEVLVVAYLGEQVGLRKVVARFSCGQAQVGYVTLWGWTAGLGRYALGRDEAQPAATFAAVLAETETKRLPDLGSTFEEPVRVRRCHWRTPRRRDELGAVQRLLKVAREVARRTRQATRFPLATWVCLLFTINTAVRMSWWATFPFTRIEHMAHETALVASSAPVEEEAPRCPTRTRSPPGGSNR